MLAAKVVDDILATRFLPDLKAFVGRVSSKYELGNVVFSPGTFSFFGLTISHDDSGVVQIHGDEKLSALESYPLSRMRRKHIDDQLNAVERFSYISLNVSLGFIGTSPSPFCSFATSYLQQKRSDPLIKDLISQTSILRRLKALGTTITMPRPENTGEYPLQVLVFSDAGRFRNSSSSQLGFVAGLVIGDIAQGTIFHTLYGLPTNQSVLLSLLVRQKPLRWLWY